MEDLCLRYQSGRKEYVCNGEGLLFRFRETALLEIEILTFLKLYFDVKSRAADYSRTLHRDRYTNWRYRISNGVLEYELEVHGTKWRYRVRSERPGYQMDIQGTK